MHLSQPQMKDAIIGKFEVITDEVMYDIAEADQRRVEYEIGNLHDMVFTNKAETIPFLLYEKCPVDHPSICVTKYSYH